MDPKFDLDRVIYEWEAFKKENAELHKRLNEKAMEFLRWEKISGPDKDCGVCHGDGEYESPHNGDLKKCYCIKRRAIYKEVDKIYDGVAQNLEEEAGTSPASPSDQERRISNPEDVGSLANPRFPLPVGPDEFFSSRQQTDEEREIYRKVLKRNFKPATETCLGLEHCANSPQGLAICTCHEPAMETPREKRNVILKRWGEMKPLPSGALASGEPDRDFDGECVRDERDWLVSHCEQIEAERDALRGQLKDAEREIETQAKWKQKAEAGAAALREALQVATTPLAKDRQEVLRALSSTAGREFLERLRKAEEASKVDGPVYNHGRSEGQADGMWSDALRIQPEKAYSQQRHAAEEAYKLYEKTSVEASAMREALSNVLGQQHVLKYAIKFIEDWSQDPNIKPAEELAKVRYAIEAWHHALVEATKPEAGLDFLERLRIAYEWINVANKNTELAEQNDLISRKGWRNALKDWAAVKDQLKETVGALDSVKQIALELSTQSGLKLDAAWANVRSFRQQLHYTLDLLLHIYQHHYGKIPQSPTGILHFGNDWLIDTINQIESLLDLQLTEKK